MKPMITSGELLRDEIGEERWERDYPGQDGSGIYVMVFPEHTQSRMFGDGSGFGPYPSTTAARGDYPNADTDQRLPYSVAAGELCGLCRRGDVPVFEEIHGEQLCKACIERVAKAQQ